MVINTCLLFRCYLLEAIIKQDWYSFKNKELVVFDKKNGLLFPNFNNAPHIPFSNWENIKNEYAPHGIGLGEWDINKDSSNVFWYPIEKYRGSQNVSLVHSCYQRSRQKSRTNLFYSTVTTYYQEDYIIYMTANNFSETGVLENGEVESISNEKLKGVSYDSICATRKNYRDISKQRIN